MVTRGWGEGGRGGLLATGFRSRGMNTSWTGSARGSSGYRCRVRPGKSLSVQTVNELCTHPHTRGDYPHVAEAGRGRRAQCAGPSSASRTRVFVSAIVQQGG